jgi:hypothetical protein
MIVETLYVVSFCILWKLYTDYSKYVGLYLTIVAFFLVSILPCIISYNASLLLKVQLIVFTSFCVFLGILYKSTRNLVNPILTWLLRINVGVMYFANENVFLKGMMLFIAITTPYFTTSDQGIIIRSSFFNKDLWVLLYTIGLGIFYTVDVEFFTHNSYHLLLISIMIPLFLHFISNKFLESRILLLCLCIVFYLFNHDKPVFKTITDCLKLE